MYLRHSYSLSHSGGSFVGLYSRMQKPFRSSVPDGTFSPELEVKHVNKNSIGCFSKIYVTRHQSISIRLSFETSPPPFCFVQHAGGSQRWELLASQRHKKVLAFRSALLITDLAPRSIRQCTFPFPPGSLLDIDPNTVTDLEARVPR